MKTDKVVPVTDPVEIARLMQSGGDSKRVEAWCGGKEPSTCSPLVLFCTKCNLSTSGIPSEKPKSHRRCPTCNSLLIYCPVCRQSTSATEKFNIIICDRCKQNFVTESTVEHLASLDHSAREVVLSGIRATGHLHLGNYLGAIRQFVEYEKGDNLCMYFIADWHTLTTCQDPEKISTNTLEIATDYLAAGLNPEMSIIYAQSSVPELAELSLYLAMFQKKNELEDMPTLKDLVKDSLSVSMGHLYYPVLMAADILGPQATLVPVGRDQVPNVELAIRLAKKFNSAFGQTFVVPKIGLRTIKVPSLSGGKMGKSEQATSIEVTDGLEEIKRKYLKFGVTHTRLEKEPGDPSRCVSVFPVHELLLESDQPALKQVREECLGGTRTCSNCKIELAKRIDKLFQPVRERRRGLLGKPDYVKEVLHFGGIKAREIIRPTITAVRSKLGLPPM